MDTTIAETYLLLAYDERTGYPAIDTSVFRTVLGAAVVLDLVEQGALELEGEGKKATVRRTSLHVGDDHLRKVVDIADGKRVQQAVTYQASVGATNLEKVKDGLLEHLVELGALRKDEGRFLWVFPTTAFKEDDASVEEAGRAVLRAAILADPEHDAELDDRTRALVGLAIHGELIVKVLPDLDKRTVRQRAKQIVESEPVHGAVSTALSSAIASMTAALLTAAIVPTITST